MWNTSHNDIQYHYTIERHKNICHNNVLMTIEPVKAVKNNDQAIWEKNYNETNVFHLISKPYTVISISECRGHFHCQLRKTREDNLSEHKHLYNPWGG